MRPKAYASASITEKEYIAEEQLGKCAICGNSVNFKSHLDHCHASGFTRGVLCPLCNAGVGQLGDDPERLRRAADYLEWAQKRISHFEGGGEYVPPWVIHKGEADESQFAERWLEADRLGLNTFAMQCFIDGYIDKGHAVYITENNMNSATYQPPPESQQEGDH